jgi:O-antigen/teichoic acid export membrane protein
MSSTHRALLFSFLDRYSALLLSIASSMAIARLLTPAEIGVYSVTMVFIMFISSMRDFGAGPFLVQERSLNPERIQAAWTVLLGTGLLMSLVTLAAAIPVAHFFKEPRMVRIMGVISLNFALNPMGALTYAWLMREMRFDALAVMRLVSSLAGAATSVSLAYLGHGPISMAYGSLAATAVNAAVSLRYRPSEFGWRPGFGEVRRVMGFGGRLWATSVTTSLASGAPEFLVGKLQNLTAAGLYSRANGLTSMFQKLVLDATQAVVLPLMAKAHRESGRLDEPMLRALSFVTVLGWSFLGGLALLGYPVTRLLYGNQWDGSVGLMRILALGTALGLPSSLCPNALLATGRVSRILKTTLIVAPMQVALVGAGACFGLEAAGCGFAIAQLLSLPIWMRVSRNELGMHIPALARALARSAGVAAVANLAPLSAVLMFGIKPGSNLTAILYSLPLGLILFVFGAAWLKHPIYAELTRLVAALKWPVFLKRRS